VKGLSLNKLLGLRDVQISRNQRGHALETNIIESAGSRSGGNNLPDASASIGMAFDKSPQPVFARPRDADHTSCRCVASLSYCMSQVRSRFVPGALRSIGRCRSADNRRRAALMHSRAFSCGSSIRAGSALNFLIMLWNCNDWIQGARQLRLRLSQQATSRP